MENQPRSFLATAHIVADRPGASVDSLHRRAFAAGLSLFVDGGE